MTMYLSNVVKNDVYMAMQSPIGPLYLVATDKGLKGIYFTRPKAIRAEENLILRQALKELTAYFAGEQVRFSVPLDLQGTDFQIQVWRELLRIPYGKTCSYRDIAARIRNPKAVRAVGGANGKNPLCVIVPCHRVIAADGSIGGYTGGLKKKEFLLNLERRHRLQ